MIGYVCLYHITKLTVLKVFALRIKPAIINMHPSPQQKTKQWNHNKCKTQQNGCNNICTICHVRFSACLQFSTSSRNSHCCTVGDSFIYNNYPFELHLLDRVYRTVECAGLYGDIINHQSSSSSCDIVPVTNNLHSMDPIRQCEKQPHPVIRGSGFMDYFVIHGNLNDKIVN